MAAVPSDAELSAAVGDILAVENLESLTVRTMMAILAGRFHGVDLTPRKRFIKDEVDRLMHMHTPVQPDDVAHADGGGGYDHQQPQQQLQSAYPPAGVAATCTFPFSLSSLPAAEGTLWLCGGAVDGVGVASASGGPWQWVERLC